MENIDNKAQEKALILLEKWDGNLDSLQDICEMDEILMTAYLEGLSRKEEIRNYILNYSTPAEMIQRSKNPSPLFSNTNSNTKCDTLLDSGKFTPSEEQEIKNHENGLFTMLISFLIMLMGGVAPILGGLGGIGLVVGFFITFSNRSKESISIQKEQNKRMAELMVKTVQAGGKIDTDKYVSNPKTSSGTKEIVKGAVVGGIIGGDAGAVVGAIAAKNKLDNANKSSNSSASTKDIVKGAVVGSIIGGDAGAVVGAIAAKNKGDNK